MPYPSITFGESTLASRNGPVWSASASPPTPHDRPPSPRPAPNGRGLILLTKGSPGREDHPLSFSPWRSGPVPLPNERRPGPPSDRLETYNALACISAQRAGASQSSAPARLQFLRAMLEHDSRFWGYCNALVRVGRWLIPSSVSPVAGPRLAAPHIPCKASRLHHRIAGARGATRSYLVPAQRAGGAASRPRRPVTFSGKEMGRTEARPVV